VLFRSPRLHGAQAGPACRPRRKPRYLPDVKRPKSNRRSNPTDGKIDLSSLSNVAGFNLRMLDLRMMKSFGERIAETGLTPAAASVVLVVESNPGISLGRLADALLVKRPNMTKLVKRLEARGLVRRNAAANDGRSISAALTLAGRRSAKRLRALQALHDAWLLAVLRPAERVQLMRYVARILHRLDSTRQRSA